MTNATNRREFLTASAALIAGSGTLISCSASAQQTPIPIIDTHIHFFDTTRPIGVPYPAKNAIPPGLPIATPQTFRRAVASLGIEIGRAHV